MKRGRMASERDHRLMNDDQWDEFWLLIDARRQDLDARPNVLLPHHRLQPAFPATVGPTWRGDSAAAAVAKLKNNPRSNRCGACTACRASDCGRCKNCRDKPRFGGPGIKKKACLARICLREVDDGASDEETVALEAPASATTAEGASQGCDHRDAQGEEEGMGRAAGSLHATSAVPSLTESSVDTSLNASPSIRPSSPLSQAEDQAPLPEGWEAGVDPTSHRTYHVHAERGQTQWDRPTGGAARDEQQPLEPSAAEPPQPGASDHPTHPSATSDANCELEMFSQLMAGQRGGSSG